VLKIFIHTMQLFEVWVDRKLQLMET